MDDFDARRALLDVPPGVPRASWSTQAVLYGLRRDLTVPPWFADEPTTRTAVILEALEVLNGRGFDTDSLLRLGLGDRLQRAVVAGVTAYEAVRYSRARAGADLPLMSLPRIWSDLLAVDSALTASLALPPATAAQMPAGARIDDLLCMDDDDAAVGLMLSDAPHTVAPDLTSRIRFALRRLTSSQTDELFQRWLAGASVANLIDWSGPTEYPPPHALPEGLRDQYRWLVDRFTVTYFGRWSTSSLHLEWRWARGEVDSPCRPEEMVSRQIRPTQIADEIARRAAGPTDEAGPAHRPLDLLGDHALRLIEGGQRQVAADLFDAARQQDPGNAEAQNNFGFCTLIDDPSEALQALVTANELGYANSVTNAVDRMQCHLLLGQPKAAIRIAERVLKDWDELTPRMPAYLWSFAAAREPRLINVPDARPIVMALASVAATPSVDVELWMKRHDDACAELLVDCECLLTSPMS